MMTVRVSSAHVAKTYTQSYRDTLVAELGWARENPLDPYIATTKELSRWVNQSRALRGIAPITYFVFEAP